MRTHSKLYTALLLILSLALAGLLGMRPTPAHAATIVVDTVTDENDGSCADGDCSLRDAIATAADGDTIVFDASLSGQTITLALGTLQIATSLTIDGSGLAQHVKISGDHASRVFITLNGDGIVLQELDIVNGNVADGFGGSGIYNQGTLTVVGCTIADNTTPENGGGIRNTGTLVVEHSSVSNNQAGYGGGIRNEGNLTVSDSTISDNTADFGGGIDNYVGSMEMHWTTVERNTAVHYGGGLTTGANAVIEDSTFRDNTAENGGGIGSHEAGGTLTLARCTFTGNTAHSPGGHGGALNNDQATAEVNDSTFEGNAADVSGGGIYNAGAGTLTVNDSTFTGNTASSTADGYGGAIGNSGTLALNRATFADNTALWNGGAIENWGGDLTVTGCTFTGNRAVAGGALNNNAGGTLTMADSTLRENTAETGGGLFSDNNSPAEVTGSTFVGNSATVTTGGGIENRGGSPLTAHNSTFSANTAATYGGGINNHDGVLTLTNVTLAGNSSGGGGGLSIATAGTLNYRNTIIAGSPSGGDCNNEGTLGENVNNLVEDGSCSPLLTGDPRLGPLADNGGPTETHALQPDSPAIDMGDPATCPTADQRGEARDDWACDIGAFELKAADSDHVVKAIGGPGVYTFGPTKVKVEVVTQGALDSLRVTRVVGDHPGRTGGGGGGGSGGVGWGEWFVLAPNDGANGTFSASLTLPTLFVPDANDKVCRYLGGTAWDCAAHGFGQTPFAHITRAEVTAFSDWAAGNEVGPNAVTVRDFRGRAVAGGLPAALAGLLVGLAVAAAAVAPRRREM